MGDNFQEKIQTSYSKFRPIHSMIRRSQDIFHFLIDTMLIFIFLVIFKVQNVNYFGVDRHVEKEPRHIWLKKIYNTRSSSSKI